MYRKMDRAITIHASQLNVFSAFEDSFEMHSPLSCIPPLVRFGVVIVALLAIFAYWFWTDWLGGHGTREASDDQDGQQSERIGTPVHVLSTRAVCCKYCSAGSASDVYLYCINRKQT